RVPAAVQRPVLHLELPPRVLLHPRAPVGHEQRPRREALRARCAERVRAIRDVAAQAGAPAHDPGARAGARGCRQRVRPLGARPRGVLLPRLEATTGSRVRPGLRRMAGRCACLHAGGIMTITATDLRSRSRGELDEIFRASPAGSLPKGGSRGTALVFPGTLADRIVGGLIRLFVWRGKMFRSGETGSYLKNFISPLALELFRAEV